MVNEEHLLRKLTRGLRVWKLWRQYPEVSGDINPDLKQLNFLLTQGVQIWNTWRQEHPEISIALNGADLGRETATIAAISQAVRSRTDLSGTPLLQAIVREVQRREIDLSGVNLSRASLRRADSAVHT
jgi:uncharacterized protein YjbI with pentapeptide repeats